MNRSTRLIVVGIAVALLSFAQPRLGAAGRVVSFRLADGRTLSGVLMEAPDRPAPAVVLVPMLGGSREDWLPVAQRLSEAGISALAIDLPGTAPPEVPAELTRWSEAVTGAVAYLASDTSGVRTGAIGVAGASLGANLSVVAAAANPAISALTLVSPSLDYRGVRIESPFMEYGSRPALLVASVQDPYAARSVRTLTRKTSGAHEVRWSSVAAHGTVLLARDPELTGALVEWFRRTLGGK